jgi:hypothetical protein
MNRAVAALLSLVIVSAVPTFAQSQVDAAGEWAVSFTTPSGPNDDFTMYVSQTGARLSGRLVSQSGEFPLKGTVDGNQFTIVWSFPDGGQMLEITFSGKIDGDQMTGTCKLGRIGEGEMQADRTGR